MDAGGWDGSVAKLGDDCDDTDAGIYPGLSWYRDGDNDGFGAGEATLSCAQPENHVRNNTDCNDSRDFVYPGAGELCDGIVNNCSNPGEVVSRPMKLIMTAMAMSSAPLTAPGLELRRRKAMIATTPTPAFRLRLLVPR